MHRPISSSVSDSNIFIAALMAFWYTCNSWWLLILSPVLRFSLSATRRRGDWAMGRFSLSPVHPFSLSPFHRFTLSRFSPSPSLQFTHSPIRLFSLSPVRLAQAAWSPGQSRSRKDGPAQCGTFQIHSRQSFWLSLHWFFPGYPEFLFHYPTEIMASRL